MTASEWGDPERVIAGTIGVVAWIAILLSLGNSLVTHAGSPAEALAVVVTFSSFFTIWTNTAIAIALTVPLAWPTSSVGRFLGRPGVRTALATAITIVALAYELLLRQSWAPISIDLLTNLLVHYLIPVAFVAYWALFTPKRSLGWRDPVRWSLYYLAYAAYALVLGEITGAYPYPFVDVTELGYVTTLTNAAGFWILFVLVGTGYVALGRLQVRNAGTPADA